MRSIYLIRHKFMAAFYGARFRRILKDTKTSGDVLRNSSELETSLEKMIPHMKKVVSLASEGRRPHKNHEEYSQMLRLLEEAYEKSKENNKIKRDI